MFLAEVVGKRVVVQGLWIGGWCWGEVPPGNYDAIVGKEGRRQHTAANGAHEGGGGDGMAKAPWAR